MYLRGKVAVDLLRRTSSADDVADWRSQVLRPSGGERLLALRVPSLASPVSSSSHRLSRYFQRNEKLIIHFRVTLPDSTYDYSTHRSESSGRELYSKDRKKMEGKANKIHGTIVAEFERIRRLRSVQGQFDGSSGCQIRRDTARSDLGGEEER